MLTDTALVCLKESYSDSLRGREAACCPPVLRRFAAANSTSLENLEASPRLIGLLQKVFDNQRKIFILTKLSFVEDELQILSDSNVITIHSVDITRILCKMYLVSVYKTIIKYEKNRNILIHNY